jgi:hypothetical protein
MIYQSCKLVQIHIRVFEKEHFMQNIVNMGANDLNFFKISSSFFNDGPKNFKMHHN